MTFSIASLAVSRNVCLAPMSGVTDVAYRTLARRYGAPLMASEMLAAALLAERPSRCPDFSREAPLMVQLMGADPGVMARAGRIVADRGAAIIDVNMGCPVRKVVANGCGAALMRDPDRAVRVVEALVRAVAVPVSVKMRLGWDETDRNAASLARRLEEAGAALITVHGRTRQQLYAGAADWAAVREAVGAVRVPVVVNGDVTDGASARAALSASGAAAVMVGRAACGRPWLAGRLAAELALGGAPGTPPVAERRDLLLEQLDLMGRFYGMLPGLRAARKHLSWATREMPGACSFRRRIFAAETHAEARALIVGFFDRADNEKGRTAA